MHSNATSGGRGLSPIYRADLSFSHPACRLHRSVSRKKSNPNRSLTLLSRRRLSAADFAKIVFWPERESRPKSDSGQSIGPFWYTGCPWQGKPHPGRALRGNAGLWGLGRAVQDPQRAACTWTVYIDSTERHRTRHSWVLPSRRRGGQPAMGPFDVHGVL